MRSVLVGIIAVSLSAALVTMARAQQPADGAPGLAHMTRPVGHAQPTAPGVAAADRIKSEESGTGKMIDQEDERIDRLIRGICRGC